MTKRLMVVLCIGSSIVLFGGCKNPFFSQTPPAPGADTLVSILVHKAPDKMLYRLYDPAPTGSDLTGIEIKGVYGDGHINTLTYEPEDLKVQGYQDNQEGIQHLTVTVQEKTDSFRIVLCAVPSKLGSPVNGQVTVMNQADIPENVEVEVYVFNKNNGHKERDPIKHTGGDIKVTAATGEYIVFLLFKANGGTFSRFYSFNVP